MSKYQDTTSIAQPPMTSTEALQDALVECLRYITEECKDKPTPLRDYLVTKGEMALSRSHIEGGA